MQQHLQQKHAPRCLRLRPGKGTALPASKAKKSRRMRYRPRQEAKRATFPFINGQIIAVSDTGDLALTLSIIETYISDMNLVNMATALHRLAKLSANDKRMRAALQEHSVVAQLVEFAKLSLKRTQEAGGSPHCQVLSNIVWALATLQIPDLQLLEAIALLSCKQLADFKPFELSAAIWAFASFTEEGLLARRFRQGFF